MTTEKIIGLTLLAFAAGQIVGMLIAHFWERLSLGRHREDEHVTQHWEDEHVKVPAFLRRQAADFRFPEEK